MIKNLKNKFLICLFLLVTVFSVTSSCFAYTAIPYNAEHYIGWVTSSGVNWRFTCNIPFYLKPELLSDGKYYLSAFDFSNNSVIVSLYQNGVDFWKKEVSDAVIGIGSDNSFFDKPLSDFEYKGKVKLYDTDGNLFLSSQVVDVSHIFQSDTSAKINFDYSSYGSNASVLKYSLTGVELNTDLTAPIQLRNPVTYTPRSNKFSC